MDHGIPSLHLPLRLNRHNPEYDQMKGEFWKPKIKPSLSHAHPALAAFNPTHSPRPKNSAIFGGYAQVPSYPRAAADRLGSFCPI
jgi:hypothetical protein